MRREIKIFLSGMLVLLCVAILFTEFKKPDMMIEENIVRKNSPTIKIKPLRFSQEGEDKTKFVLNADKAQFFQGEGKGIITNFRLAYTYDGSKKISIAGKSAIIKVSLNKDLTLDIDQADIYAQDKITVKSSEGYNFETQKLLWEGSEGLISTDEPILFYGNNFTISGLGLKADLNEEKIEIYKDVKLVSNKTPVQLSHQKPKLY